MKAICAVCLVLMFGLSAYADENHGELIANFNIYTVIEIPSNYLDKPIHIPMPSYWDEDMQGVRVKAVYKNSKSLTGVSAHYLSPTIAPREVLEAVDTRPTMRVELSRQHPDIMFMHFVFRQKKGTICEFPD